MLWRSPWSGRTEIVQYKRFWEANILENPGVSTKKSIDSWLLFILEPWNIYTRSISQNMLFASKIQENSFFINTSHCCIKRALFPKKSKFG